ncbi:MAG TPA: PEGA domain-containing protein [Bryobacteraceae bacterium]|nr:PEGA domain-containing protein [Bryobacteraceae bacterium]
MKKGLLLLAAAVMVLAPASAAARVRVGIGFGGWYAPYAGWYAPYWGPYWSPGYGGYYEALPAVGHIKLDTKVKTAQVYIDGAYAGDTGSNKNLRLRPGKYDVRIDEGGQTRFNQQIYVAAGQTVHLRPTL